MIVLNSNRTSSGRRGLRFLRPGLIRRWWRVALCLAGLALVAVAMAGSFVAGAIAQRENYLKEWRHKYTPRAVGNRLRALVSSTELTTLYIDMKYKHLHRIQQKRNEALERGILLTSDADFVPAQLRVGEEAYRVKMRLKGDWVDHLETDKWSFRVHLKDQKKLLGMRRFSIQHPMTRHYLNEWAFLENVRMEGLIAPRFRFVNLVFQGTNKGIYALDEHFAKELIESSGRREGVILKFDEQPVWINQVRISGADTLDRVFLHTSIARGTFRQAEAETYAANHIEGDPKLRQQRDAGISALLEFVQGQRLASEVFDVELVARYLALTDLWSADHALHWHNLRFYYNPITAKLEPVAFDANPRHNIRQENYWMATDCDEPFVHALVEDPAIATAYVKALDRMTAPEYLRSLRQRLEAPLEEILRSLHREWPALAPPWEALERKRQYIHGAMNPVSLAIAYVRGRPAAGPGDRYPDATLEVANVLTLPIEMLGYQINDSALTLSAPMAEGHEGHAEPVAGDRGTVILPPVRADGRSSFVRFLMPWEAATAAGGDGNPPRVSVVVRMAGRSGIASVAARILLAGPRELREPTMAEALARHPFLSRMNTTDDLRVRQGEWELTTDLVVPRGVSLHIGPGTTLRFASDALLYASGSLRFEGTENQPIVLAANGEDWPGLVVDRAMKLSRLMHVVLQDTRGVDRDGWFLTGGATFYESPVTLSHCRIVGSTAEDLINVVHADFEFVDSEFGSCASDAFDGDYVSGKIERCGFHDVSGDAVDLSGSKVQLRDLVMRRIADKGISVGEASKVTATTLRMDHVGIGAASKDDSNLVIEGMTVRDARIVLAAYNKKPEYGPATIRASAVSMERIRQQTLVQEHSFLKLNGKEIPGRPLDAKALYEQGILGN